MPSCSAVSA